MRTLVVTLALLAVPATAQELHACKALHETPKIKSDFTVSGPVIVEKPALRLIGRPGAFTAETATLGIDALWASFAAFDQWIVGMTDKVAYGVCYDGTDGGGFRYLAGAEVTGEAPPPEGFAALTVPAATYAVYTQQGLAWTIANARWRIHAGMLPEGYALADAPELEVYPEDYVPRSPRATMEIWIPVVPD
jgi:AraC family transcriptional regulator